MLRQSDDQADTQLVGYARVSTDEQDLSVQLRDLRAVGIPKDRLFSEHVSGAARRLPEREKALKMACRAGWGICVHRLDRLGRSVRDVINIAHELDKAGAHIVTLRDGIDTRVPLTGKLLLGMLALVAEFERGIIAARTKAAMAAKKADGAKFGPPRKVTPAVAKAIKRDLTARDPATKKPLWTIKEVAAKHGITDKTVTLYFPRLRSKMGLTKAGRPARKAKR